VNKLLAELEDLKTLKENWDSYGDLPTNPKTIDKAREFIQHLPLEYNW